MVGGVTPGAGSPLLLNASTFLRALALACAMSVFDILVGSVCFGQALVLLVFAALFLFLFLFLLLGIVVGSEN